MWKTYTKSRIGPDMRGKETDAGIVRSRQNIQQMSHWQMLVDTPTLVIANTPRADAAHVWIAWRE